MIYLVKSSCFHELSNSGKAKFASGYNSFSTVLKSQAVDISDFTASEEGWMNVRYGTSLENSPTLVLNADYSPISYLPLSLWSWQDALRTVFSDKAVIVHEYKLSIRSVNFEIKLPSVIALKEYHCSPEFTPLLSKYKVHLRDNFQCQVSDMITYHTQTSLYSPS
jgi:hypothetical protein